MVEPLTVAAPARIALTAQSVRLPFGVLVGGLPASAEAALGSADISFHDEQGNLLAAQPYFYQGELHSYLGAPFAQGRAWLVDTDANRLNLTLQDHAGSQQLAIDVASNGTQAASLVPDDRWIVANFKETQVRGMAPGQRVDFTVDAYPGRVFHGQVELSLIHI